MTEANWFGSPPSDTPPFAERPDRTPAEMDGTRSFDKIAHVADMTSGRPAILPLNLRRRQERGLLRSLLRRLAGDV